MINNRMEDAVVISEGWTDVNIHTDDVEALQELLGAMEANEQIGRAPGRRCFVETFLIDRAPVSRRVPETRLRNEQYQQDLQGKQIWVPWVVGDCLERRSPWQTRNSQKPFPTTRENDNAMIERKKTRMAYNRQQQDSVAARVNSDRADWEMSNPNEFTRGTQGRNLNPATPAAIGIHVLSRVLVIVNGSIRSRVYIPPMGRFAS